MISKLEKSAIMCKVEESLSSCYDCACDAGARLRLHENCSCVYLEPFGGCDDDGNCDCFLMEKMHRQIAFFHGVFSLASCLLGCRMSDVVSDFCKRHGYSFEVVC